MKPYCKVYFIYHQPDIKWLNGFNDFIISVWWKKLQWPHPPFSETTFDRRWWTIFLMQCSCTPSAHKHVFALSLNFYSAFSFVPPFLLHSLPLSLLSSSTTLTPLSSHKAYLSFSLTVFLPPSLNFKLSLFFQPFLPMSPFFSGWN